MTEVKASAADAQRGRSSPARCCLPGSGAAARPAWRCGTSRWPRWWASRPGRNDQHRPGERGDLDDALALAVACSPPPGCTSRAERRDAVLRAEAEVARLVRSTESTLNRSLLGIDQLLAGLQEALLQQRPSGRRAARSHLGTRLRMVASQNLMVRELCVVSGDGRMVACAHEGHCAWDWPLPPGFVEAVLSQSYATLAVNSPAVSPRQWRACALPGTAAGRRGQSQVVAVAEVPVALMSALVEQAAGIEAVGHLERDNGEPAGGLSTQRQPAGPAPDEPSDRRAGGWQITRHAPMRVDGSEGILASRTTLYPSLIVTVATPLRAVLAPQCPPTPHPTGWRQAASPRC